MPYDVIIGKVHPGGHTGHLVDRSFQSYPTITYAVVGSLRLAQKLNKKIGDIFAKTYNRNKQNKLMQEVINQLGASGSIYLRSGVYNFENIKLPLPCSFIFDSEDAEITISLSFDKKTELIANSLFQLKNISTRGRKYNIYLPSMTWVVMENVWFHGGEKALYIDGGWGMKIIEFFWGMGGAPANWDFNSPFCSIISAESFNFAYYGPGTLHIGPHTAIGEHTTHPIYCPKHLKRKLKKPYNTDEYWRKCYPTTCLGAGRECGSATWHVNGAYMILVGCYCTGGGPTYKKSNDGKFIIIGGKPAR